MRARREEFRIHVGCGHHVHPGYSGAGLHGIAFCRNHEERAYLLPVLSPSCFSLARPDFLLPGPCHFLGAQDFFKGNRHFLGLGNLLEIVRDYDRKLVLVKMSPCLDYFSIGRGPYQGLDRSSCFLLVDLLRPDFLCDRGVGLPSLYRLGNEPCRERKISYPSVDSRYSCHLLVHHGVPIMPASVVVGGSLLACERDRKSTRLNSSHSQISYAVFCLKKKQ